MAEMVKGSIEVECLDIHLDFIQEYMGRYAAELRKTLDDLGVSRDDTFVSFATSDGICEYY